ncbi:dUTP pyrophosphatase [Mammaliicoccus sciuri]|uniref:dUTP diphosphatase n=1 Tax=Mammaliicoccus sciuri TaxID=1296 RepID=UPI003364B666
MNNLNIKLLSDNATLPDRGHPDDAGLDIYAAETVTLNPQEKRLINTDLAVNIPKGYVGLLTSRSGVSSKTELVVETGKIDAGYNGHMKVNIKNDLVVLIPNGTATNNIMNIKGEMMTTEQKENFCIGTYVINKGDKIAQLVIVPIVTPEVNVVEEFESESERGTNGFGSSGY